MNDDEIVRAGTRRIVGREALRRASRMVADWQAEERGRAILARRIVVTLAAAAALTLGIIHALRYF